MKKYLLFLFLLCVFAVQAQVVIKGQVFDEKTKESIPEVSFYVNNTTIGTVADNDGKFAIDSPLKGAIALLV